MKKINRAQLDEMGACSRGLHEFEDVFGEADVEATVENCRKIDPEYLRWFSAEVFTSCQFHRFAKIWDVAMVSMMRGHTTEEAYAAFKAEVTKSFIEIWNENEND